MNLIKQITKGIGASALGLAGLFGMTTETFAQLSYPYTADFESATCVPATSTYASADPIVMNGVAWTMPGMFLGTMLANDKYIDARAGRLRLTSNDAGDPGYIATAEDFTSGVGTFSFWAADYGTEDGSTLTVQYSTDGGATWIDVATLTSEEITGEMQEFSFDINQGGNVRLKLIKDAAAARVNLDNFTVTLYEDPSIISVLSKTPSGTGVSLSTDALTITYNHPIANGTGTITVHEADDATATQVFTVPSTAVTLDGPTATISGLTVENFTSYYVTMTEGAFQKASDATVKNEAITGPTAWTFTTVDMTPPPTFTELNETFAGCVSPELTSLFSAYSVTGSRTWNCTTFGNGDANAVRINAGSAEGVSEANEDWLISNNIFDLTSVSNAKLNFFMKRRFEGALDLKVKYSTNYTGVGNPNEATWTDLASYTSIADVDSWTAASPIDMTSVPEGFYLAFVYTSGETGAIELSIDDIKFTSATTSVDDINGAQNTLKVIGDATTHNINLSFNTVQAGEYTFQVIDLNGRVMNSFVKNIQAGDNTIHLTPLNIAHGTYIISVVDANGQSIVPVKAVVR